MLLPRIPTTRPCCFRIVSERCSTVGRRSLGEACHIAYVAVVVFYIFSCILIVTSTSSRSASLPPSVVLNYIWHFAGPFGDSNINTSSSPAGSPSHPERRGEAVPAAPPSLVSPFDVTSLTEGLPVDAAVYLSISRHHFGTTQD